MTDIFNERLSSWSKNPEIAPRLTLLTPGVGHRAFSAGGDMVARHKFTTGPNPDLERMDYVSFQEYLVIHRMAHAKHFQIAVWDGIVMGASVGISINSDVRIATSKTMFAMPEAELGLFTDVGASYWLPRAVNDEVCFGLYLALTGKRIFGKDMVKWGLATHYVPDEKLDLLK